MTKCDALRDFVPFVQFKKHEKYHQTELLNSWTLKHNYFQIRINHQNIKINVMYQPYYIDDATWRLQDFFRHSKVTGIDR